MSSAVKKQIVFFLLFITKGECVRDDFSSTSQICLLCLYISELLWKTIFVTIFFRDFPVISVLDWIVARNDSFKLLFPWLFKGNVIQLLQTEFKWKCKHVFQTYILWFENDKIWFTNNFDLKNMHNSIFASTNATVPFTLLAIAGTVGLLFICLSITPEL